MKKYIILLLIPLLILPGCKRDDADGYKFDNSVYLDVSATRCDQTANFSNNIESLSRDLCLTLAYPEDEDVTATVAVDKSLVAEYNSKHGTSYAVLPEKYYTFPSQKLTVAAGHTTSDPATLTLQGLMGEGDEQTGALTLDETYLLPVSITSSSISSMEGADVAYYLFKRSSAITVAAQLTDNWINFPTLDEAGDGSAAFNGLENVTYEALIYIDKFDLSNDFGNCQISTVMGMEQYLLLRIGDASFERQQLQFDGSGCGFGKFPSSNAEKKLYEGQWYHVAATVDSKNDIVRVYVNGKIQSEATDAGVSTPINLAQRALGTADAYQFFVGKSYNDYRPLQGKIAEVRVWNVARTPDQIWDNMYRIENPSSDPTLIGYWKFNEGKGNTIKDYSMYGNDGVAEYDITWPEGIEIPEINKEEE